MSVAGIRTADMRYRACDEIAADAIRAIEKTKRERGIEVRLRLEIIEALVAFVADRYATSSQGRFESLLDRAITDCDAGATEIVRATYKSALGMIFQKRKRERDDIKNRPFAPR